MDIIKALLSALIWSFCYLYIRRYFNPEIKDYKKYKTDAIYGGVASFVATIMKQLI
jgi:hypothetical protein